MTSRRLSKRSKRSICRFTSARPCTSRCFFFQAEDGIRDLTVTGVQTCALPISGAGVGAAVSATFAYLRKTDSGARDGDESFIGLSGRLTLPFGEGGAGKVLVTRSEERRVGRGGRGRGRPGRPDAARPEPRRGAR